jgi:hypothetical protein
MTSRSFKRSVLRSINNISVARILPGVCNPRFYRTSLFGFYDYSTQLPIMRSLRCLLNTNTRVVAGSLRGRKKCRAQCQETTYSVEKLTGFEGFP